MSAEETSFAHGAPSATDDLLSADPDARPGGALVPAHRGNAQTEPLLPWDGRARRVWRTGKLLAAVNIGLWLIAWPLGSSLAGAERTGSFILRLGLGLDFLIWWVVSTLGILGLSYGLSVAMRIEHAADRLGRQAGQEPRTSTAETRVAALNDEIDRALGRLAEAEQLIRRQVRTIDEVGGLIGSGYRTGDADLAKERDALIALTDEMNRQAERVAETIARRTGTDGEDGGGPALPDRESFEAHLVRLEEVSARSLQQFVELDAALVAPSDGEDDPDDDADLTEAKAALQRQSEWLETLLLDQRRRAARIAESISNAPQRLSQSERQQTPWRDIIATVKEQGPVPPGHRKGEPAGSSSNMDGDRDDASDSDEVLGGLSPAEVDRLLVRIQNYSLVLHTQLYGSPSHADLDRFEDGERAIFARSLTAKNIAELERRLSSEMDNNPVFRDRTAEFLRDFDRILTPLAREKDGRQMIETYLTSPIGKLYVIARNVAATD